MTSKTYVGEVLLKKNKIIINNKNINIFTSKDVLKYWQNSEK